MQWQAFKQLKSLLASGDVWRQWASLAAVANPRLDMCQTPQKTAEMNAFHEHGNGIRDRQDSRFRAAVLPPRLEMADFSVHRSAPAPPAGERDRAIESK